jgi:photoactive yellow protein
MANINVSNIAFDAPAIQTQLDAMSDDPPQYDTLDFGLIAMDLDGTIVFYNQWESRLAGISPDRTLGLSFFSDVAPCTNNYLVSGRFEEEQILDETIDYTFTLKMRPTAVRLRMLKDERSGRQYLLVKRA